MADDDALDFFDKMFESQGVAVSSVKDGHVLRFKISLLKALVEKYADKEDLAIFVKKPDFGN